MEIIIFIFIFAEYLAQIIMISYTRRRQLVPPYYVLKGSRAGKTGTTNAGDMQDCSTVRGREVVCHLPAADGVPNKDPWRAARSAARIRGG